MVSESTFRTAQSSHKSAQDAADYAKGQYDQYNAAVLAGQTEYDRAVPSLEVEKADLIAQQPILEQVKTLVANMAASMGGAAAKGKMVSLKQLPAIKKLAAAIYEPKRYHDKALKGKISALRTSLAETGTSSTVNSMVQILTDIMTSMSSRITEIDATLTKMTGHLATNKASLSEWQTKLVDLSDDADKAANIKNTAGEYPRNTFLVFPSLLLVYHIMHHRTIVVGKFVLVTQFFFGTSDLTRQDLNGEHLVKQEAYEDYHASFIDQAAKLASQLRAIATIGAKINEAIASCAAA